MTTRLENLLGAFGVAVSDSMDDAFDEACAVGDSAPAALILIRERSGHADRGAGALSGAQPLRDRCAWSIACSQAGWVARETCEDKRAGGAGAHQGRARRWRSACSRAAARVSARRSPAISAADRKVLERILPQMLNNLVTDREQADHTCRYCELRPASDRARLAPAVLL